MSYVSQRTSQFIQGMTNTELRNYIGNLERETTSHLEKVKVYVAGAVAIASCCTTGILKGLGYDEAANYSFLVTMVSGPVSGSYAAYRFARVFDVYPARLDYAQRELHKRRLEGRTLSD